MACPSGSDQAFGPRVNTACRSFDFTLFLEDSLFACIPASIALLVLPFNLWVLLRQSCRSHSVSRLLASKMIVFCAVLMTQLCFLILRVEYAAFETPASLAADVLGLITTGVILVYSYADHQRSLRPSTSLALYLSAWVLLGISRTRTLWLMRSGNQTPAVFTALMILTIAALLLESVERHPSVLPEKRSNIPEQHSGFWNRTSFVWLAATFNMGYSKVISVDDLPDLDTKLHSDRLLNVLLRSWDKYDHKGRQTLLRACFRAYLPSFVSAIIPRLCLTAFTFFQPFILNQTVTFVGLSGSTSNIGRGLIGAWALVFMGIATSKSVYQYQNYRFASRIRGGLMALVYQSALQTRMVDEGEVTAVSLMGTDIERIVQGFKNIHEIWACVLDIAVATWLLERRLSLACLAPVVLVLAFLAVTSKISVKANTSQHHWIEHVQRRLKITSETLDNMKAVKMLGISPRMSTIIQNLRLEEIKASAGYRRVLMCIILLSNVPVILAPTVTFALYVIISLYWKGGSLEVAQAFTALTLITLLVMPVVVLVQTLPSVVQCLGCFDRIQEFCNYGTLETLSPFDMCKEKTGTSEGVELMQRETKPLAFSLKAQSFRWTQSGPAILENLTINLEAGKITAIVGPVGSGKSTLLKSLLGETVSDSGHVIDPKQSMAYCSQEPWLENATILQSILGVSQYEEKWYNSVISACGLEADVQRLKKRDDTRLGSKGVNLSGGQKQRIALARAVYSRSSVILLDDVFSGQDAHTMNLVSNSLFGQQGLLRNNKTTVVLATHNRKVMASADSVIVLDRGNIVETGTPTSLYSGQNALSLSDPPIKTSTEPDAIESGQLSKENGVEVEIEAATEDLQRRNGDLSVYKYYLASSGYLAVIGYAIFIASWMFLTEFSTIWLMWWSDDNSEHPNHRVGMYMGIYALLGILGTACACIGAWFVFIAMISNSAERLHFDLLESTLRAPFSTFTATDTGDLLNRFSQDMELIDMALPLTLGNYVSTAFSCMAKFLILMVYSRYLSACVPIFGTILYFLQSFYLRTSRQVRLLGIEAKAPLYTHFSDTVAGAATIRAFGWQSQRQERTSRLIDTSQRPEYLQSCIQHWLTFVLDTLMAALATVLVAILVTWRDKFSAGNAGVSLVMIIGFGSTLARLITSWTTMESSIGAVARVKRFLAQTPREGEHLEDSRSEPWRPTSGAITIERLSVSHQPDGEAVLKDFSLTVQPCTHLAVCGRSGAGKTSVILSILQMMHIREGTIKIDGSDISTLQCDELRQQLNVIPQDAFLIPGTVRANIDPFGIVSDDQIIRALTRVSLWEKINAQGGLDGDLDVNAWSAGQKQLLALARALTRKSKILILDEAMSSVDDATEAQMQKIIDSDFKDTTVIAIMHRLNHIESYDMVALLGNGRLLQQDTPQSLADGPTKFAELLASTSHKHGS